MSKIPEVQDGESLESYVSRVSEIDAVQEEFPDGEERRRFCEFLWANQKLLDPINEVIDAIEDTRERFRKMGLLADQVAGLRDLYQDIVDDDEEDDED